MCGDARGSKSRVRVAHYSMWGGDVWGLRRTVLPALQWHLHAGICRFYVSAGG